jgi:energy-coupling factor transport system ATP-binding protein
MGIIINNLTHKYGNKIAVDNLNLEMEDNKIYGLIGESGSGKTTLLELIDGLLKPTSGEIIINDTTNIKEIRKDIGFIFQFPEEQFFEITVKKEIEYSLHNFNIRKDKVIDAVNLVGLNESILSKKIKELSNGEKRLVAIASVLVYNPKIILLDEPTIGLDNKNKSKLIWLIKQLKNTYNKTIIISSHDIDLLYDLCDDLIVLNDGKLIMYGDPVSVYKEEELLEKYNIELPSILKFERIVNKNKGIKLMHTTSINDLIKEIYRNV